MKDLIVIVMTVAFFALAVGYVALCNRIIGPDTFEGDTTDTGDAELGRCRHRRRRRRPARPGGGDRMIAFLQWQDALGLAIAALAVIYLIFVLIFPERF